ncbi:MAG: hypothetical protein JSS07_09090 [Proteobacteria bacterium]|nr:hypothetical protein [Pseudomonadota bacterium]
MKTESIRLFQQEMCNIILSNEDIDKINSCNSFEDFLKNFDKKINLIKIECDILIRYDKLMEALAGLEFNSLEIITNSLDDNAAQKLGENLTKPRSFKELSICIKKQDPSPIKYFNLPLITAKGAKILGEGVTKANLQTLTIQSSLRGLSAGVALLQALNNATNLTTLNLPDNQLFFKENKKINFINPLLDYSQDEKNEFINFGKAISKTHVEKLNLDGNDIACVELQQFFVQQKHTSPLKILTLNNNDIGNLGFEMLIESSGVVGLVNLQLRNNLISSIKQAPFKYSQLQFLDLSGNQLFDEYDKLTDIIPNTSLQKLVTSTTEAISSTIHFKNFVSALQKNENKVQNELIKFNKLLLEFYMCTEHIKFPPELTSTITKTYINAFSPTRARARQENEPQQNLENKDESSAIMKIFKFLRIY